MAGKVGNFMRIYRRLRGRWNGNRKADKEGDDLEYLTAYCTVLVTRVFESRNCTGLDGRYLDD